MISTLDNKPDVLSYAQTGKFVMYGAGQVGITLLRHLAAKDLIDNVLNFAVSDVTKEPEEIMGVPVYGAAELPVNLRVLIAVHPRFHGEITATLTKYGVTDITGVSWDCYLQVRRTIHDFSTELFRRRGASIGSVKPLLEEIASLPEVIAAHTAAFAEYENAFEGRDVVLLGTGPSLNKYQPIDGAIHIGVNRAYKFEKVKLDYLFAQDFNPHGLSEMHGDTGFQSYVDDLRKLECKKFIGDFVFHNFRKLPEKYYKEINAVKFFGGQVRMYRDIRYHPLFEGPTIMYATINFAFWCHPKRIFIVGCDGYKPDSIDHFYTHEQPKGGSLSLAGRPTVAEFVSGHIRGTKIHWERVKEFANIHYPDIEIISINPGYLKGLFKDMEM